MIDHRPQKRIVLRDGIVDLRSQEFDSIFHRALARLMFERGWCTTRASRGSELVGEHAASEVEELARERDVMLDREVLEHGEDRTLELAAGLAVRQRP